MEAKVHAVNEIRQVVHKVLLDGCVGRVHAEQVPKEIIKVKLIVCFEKREKIMKIEIYFRLLVSGLGSVQAGIVVLLLPFQIFFFHPPVITVSFTLLNRNGIL